jgi:RHS repeat-associated protein
LSKLRAAATSVQPGDCGTAPNCTCLAHTDYSVGSISGSNYRLIAVTDPAGKRRDEYRDAVNRLRYVIEDPLVRNYRTDYAYDVLDNLTTVTQGSQICLFGYSSLGRLISSNNPETNTLPNGARLATTYVYTNSGDLEAMTDARSITTSLTYDALHRIKTKTYNDGLTPGVTYDYYLAGSAASPKIGQLRSVGSAGGSTLHDNYDTLGHVVASTQTIAGSAAPYSFNYEWLRNDSLKSIQYPSGLTVNYTFDDAGRPVKAFTANRTYADLTVATAPPTAAYTPDGRIVRMRLGNELWETYDYRTPQLPTKLKVGTSFNSNDRLELEYNYSAAANNGNLLGHVIRRPGRTWTQTFTYDGLNRLLTATESGTNVWTRSYDYDQFGNRWTTNPTSNLDIHEASSFTNFNEANRIIIGSTTAASYDAAGNQTKYDPFTLSYDAENRNTSVTSPIDNVYFYYDGEGKRVKKVATGATTVTTYYVYNVLGQLVAEYSDGNTSGGTSWIHTDLLGSVRMITGDKPVNGTAPVLECDDYMPFGQLLGAGVQRPSGDCYPTVSLPLASRVSQKFTGKERDAESGLDFFGARYMSSAQGRFLSPDPGAPKPEDPQTWNRYAYVTNNPLRYIDPDGKQRVEIEMDRDGRDLLAGRITEREYMDRQYARGAGAAVGLGMILGPEIPGLARPLWSTMVGWGIMHPDKVRQTAEGLAEGLSGAAPGSLGSTVVGPFGTIARNELDNAMRAGGRTVELFTKLTQSPGAGRALSAAAGEGAQTLAEAARVTGTMYTARIPEHVIRLLQKAGLVETRQTLMNGVRGVEYRFRPEAMDYLSRYFEELKKKEP